MALHIHIYLHMQHHPVHSKREKHNLPFHQSFSTKLSSHYTWDIHVVAKHLPVIHCLFYANDIWACFIFPIGLVFKYELISNLNQVMYLQEFYMHIVQKLMMKFIGVHVRICLLTLKWLFLPSMLFHHCQRQGPVVRDGVLHIPRGSILFRLNQCSQVRLDLDVSHTQQDLAWRGWCPGERRKDTSRSGQPLALGFKQ